MRPSTTAAERWQTKQLADGRDLKATDEEAYQMLTRGKPKAKQAPASKANGAAKP